MEEFGASSSTSKIDDEAVEGLLGTEDSLAYKMAEVERHLHNTEQWFGMALVPVGETHVADDAGIATDPFTLTAGDDAFGSWVQLLGSDDTPVFPGAVKFDAHRYLVDGTNSTNAFVIQIVSGESAGIAAKLVAKEYSTTMYISPTNNNDAGIEEVMVRRTDAGEKVWARARCLGANGSTLGLFFGVHEYEG